MLKLKQLNKEKGMDVTPEQFTTALLNVTSGPDWDIVKAGLSNDIYQAQAGALDVPTWDKVCELRGFAQGLAYIINIRENTIKMMDQEEANAKL